MNSLRKRQRTLFATFLGLTAVGLGAVIKPAYQLRYNTSQSAPVGWYAVVPERDVPVGAFAFASLPNGAATLADDRGYLPKNVPILKRVVAGGGQSICTRDDQIYVDGVAIARSLSHDSEGRSLAAWKGCRRLSADELFLLNPQSAASFDSRYFGPISRSNVIGKAIPLWTW